MAEVREDTQGKIRDLPIKASLKQLLLGAATAAGVDTVRVTSGGQCRVGTCTKRIGSPRHDEGNAADLQLIVGGRTLDFENAADRKVFVKFIIAATSNGATGVGAGVAYMGSQTVHVGYGSRAVWGAGGQSANAPQWLKEAAQAGWGASGMIAGAKAVESLDSEDDELEEDQVTA